MDISAEMSSKCALPVFFSLPEILTDLPSFTERTSRSAILPKGLSLTPLGKIITGTSAGRLPPIPLTAKKSLPYTGHLPACLISTRIRSDLPGLMSNFVGFIIGQNTCHATQTLKLLQGYQAPGTGTQSHLPPFCSVFLSVWRVLTALNHIVSEVSSNKKGYVRVKC